MFPQIKRVDNSLSWDDIYHLQIESKDEETVILPVVLTDNINVANLSAAAFYPDLVNSQVSADKSFSILHNQIALTSQNPIRLFIYPIDQDGLPTVNQNISVTSNQPEDKIDIHLPSKNTDMTWADIFSTSPGNRTITTKIDDQQIDTQSVYFAPNCKDGLVSCLRNPQDMIIYIYYQVLLFLKNIPIYK
jgi:hypothetical protein